MVIFGAESLYITPTDPNNNSIAFNGGYMYVANRGNERIYRYNPLNMELTEMIAIFGSGLSVIKVYGNTLYILCNNTQQIMSIDLTVLPFSATVMFDASSDSINYGFNNFVINNGYVYVGCSLVSYVYCYHVSTGIRTRINGGGIVTRMIGVGAYNSYLYTADYNNLSIVRIPLYIANTDVTLFAKDVGDVYTFGPSYAGYIMYEFAVYYNNAVILMSNGTTHKLIHLDLDTLIKTEMNLSYPIDSYSRLAIDSNYVYITCNSGANIIRVVTGLSSFTEDFAIFRNNGYGWKIKVNCTPQFIKVNYLPV
jgi:hypothetical protein